MRPQVELIQEDGDVWPAAELPTADRRALSAGSPSTRKTSSYLRVGLHTDWSGSAGIHHASTEYYVLEDSMKHGDQRIGKGNYVYAPKGVPVDSIQFVEGTKILHYRDYSDAGLDSVDSPSAARASRRSVRHHHGK